MARPPRDEETILRIARLRYESGLLQGEIAREVGLSEATVSRHLKEAMRLGFVEVRVASRAFRNVGLERRLTREFGLAAAVVVDAQTSSIEMSRVLGNAAARVLEDLLVSGSVVGVSNGDAVASVIGEARRSRSTNIDVVTLIGGVGRAEEPSHSGEICRSLAEKLGGRAWILPVPAVVDGAAVATTLRGTAAVQNVFALMERLSIAVVGIGAMTPNSSTFRHGLFTDAHLRDMVSRHAVGSICARFYDETGTPLPTELGARTMSMTLERLAQVPHRVAVAHGRDKVPAIRAAIRGGLINVLGTDGPTAEALLAAGV